MATNYDEDKHPRDADGKFAKGHGSTDSGKAPKEKRRPHDDEPDDGEVEKALAQDPFLRSLTEKDKAALTERRKARAKEYHDNHALDLPGPDFAATWPAEKFSTGGPKGLSRLSGRELQKKKFFAHGSRKVR